MAHPLLHLRILLPFLYNCILCPLLGTIVSQVGISERNVPYPTQLAFEAFESQSPMGKGAMWPNLNVFGFYRADMRMRTIKNGAPDKPCGVGRADANPKLLLNDT